jgi:septal ring factor EnvC (AmiA/AmiB activator)
MTRAQKMLAVLAVSMLGLWGCAKAPSVATADGERIKALEAKTVRLEDDFRTAATTRDQLRKKLAAADAEQQRLRHELEQLQDLTKERDDLKQQLTARTGERDNLNTQFEQFRKGIRNLLGETEAAISQTNPSVTTTVEARAPGQL